MVFRAKIVIIWRLYRKSVHLLLGVLCFSSGTRNIITLESQQLTLSSGLTNGKIKKTSFIFTPLAQEKEKHIQIHQSNTV